MCSLDAARGSPIILVFFYGFPPSGGNPALERFGMRGSQITRVGEDKKNGEKPGGSEAVMGTREGTRGSHLLEPSSLGTRVGHWRGQGWDRGGEAPPGTESVMGTVGDNGGDNGGDKGGDKHGAKGGKYLLDLNPLGTTGDNGGDKGEDNGRDNGGDNWGHWRGQG